MKGLWGPGGARWGAIDAESRNFVDQFVDQSDAGSIVIHEKVDAGF